MQRNNRGVRKQYEGRREEVGGRGNEKERHREKRKRGITQGKERNKQKGKAIEKSARGSRNRGRRKRGKEERKGGTPVKRCRGEKVKE